MTLWAAAQVAIAPLRWVHLSSRNGDLPVPGESHKPSPKSPGSIHALSLISYRTSARRRPALVWYCRQSKRIF
jgi:hypothetical protein